jgi:hypothetical protein
MGWKNIPMKVFMECAVEQTIIPMTIREAPAKATYRRPIKSEIAPTNGHTAANARRFASTNQTHRSVPPRSP